MATVTAEMKRLLAAKDKKILDGRAAVRGLLEETKRQIVAELAAVGGESYTALNLRANLASVERYLSGFESAASSEMSKLLDASWEDGMDLVPAALREGGLGVVFGHIPGPVLQTIKDFSFLKIGGLTSDAFTKIRGELSLALLGQKTPSQVVGAIAGSLGGDKGVFPTLEARAETIARVEMGRAYSQASQVSMENAFASVPELQKQWWHAGHPKMPRASHLAAHGQVQPVDRPFLIGNIPMDFPRDPKAPVGEVINCGCEHVPWHPSWGMSKGKI